jgi:two-component system sensor histidine kinase KdpD
MGATWRRLRAFAVSPSGAYVVSGLAIATATAVLLAFRSLLGKDVVALLYVPVIIVSAGTVGRRGWWFTPTLSFLTLNFFFTPPYNTLYVADPHDWLLLGIFLVVGVVSSLEVGRLHERTREAFGRQHDLLVLNRLSRNLVSEATEKDMARVIGAVTRGSADRVLLMVSSSGEAKDLYPVEGSPSDTEMAVARWVIAQGKAVGLPAGSGGSKSDEPWPISVQWPEGVPGPARGLYLPLQSSAGDAEGVLLVEVSGADSPTVDQARLVVSVANLAAAFLERHRLQSAAVALQSLEEADKLKSSFVSAVSHDIKTPLAAAKARVTGMLERDVPWQEDRQRENLEAVAANLDRLDASIGDLLDLSRLENDAWRTRPQRHELGEILSTMLSHLPDDSRERVRVRLPESPVVVTADFRQLERALRNIIENALLYSEGDVGIGVVSGPSGVTITVADRGPGIPVAEREHVFEPFFRGSATRGAASGTGLGLAITREIMRAHGGSVRIQEDQAPGTRFVVSLPNREDDDGIA